MKKCLFWERSRIPRFLYSQQRAKTGKSHFAVFLLNLSGQTLTPFEKPATFFDIRKALSGTLAAILNRLNYVFFFVRWLLRISKEKRFARMNRITRIFRDAAKFIRTQDGPGDFSLPISFSLRKISLPFLYLVFTSSSFLAKKAYAPGALLLLSCF